MRTEEDALAPPSQLPKRASASTHQSNSVAANTGSSVSATDLPSTGQSPQSTAVFHPMAIGGTEDEPEDPPASYPTGELR